MRRLVTALLTLAFVPCFCGYVAMLSLLAYARDTDAVVASARAAGLRETSVALATEMIHQELVRSPKLLDVPRPQIALVVGEVITDPWVESVVRVAHASVLRALDGAGDTAAIELGPTKEGLTRAFTALAGRARTECAAILGPARCESSAEARAALAAYQASVRAAIRRIPERVEILGALAATGPAERLQGIIDVDTVRRRLADLDTLRWAGLAALIGCLLCIALVNRRPPGRMLQATGAALAGAALTYLAISKLLVWLAPDLLARELAAVRAEQPGTSAAASIAMDGAQQVLIEMTVRALSMATSAVIACAVAGALLLVAGRLSSRSP
jgi:hypothetical protein